MSNPTPKQPESDAEWLDEKLKTLSFTPTTSFVEKQKALAQARDTILVKFEAHEAEAVRAARLDELMHITCHKHGFGHDNCPQIQARIAELSATAEKGQV